MLQAIRDGRGEGSIASSNSPAREGLHATNPHCHFAFIEVDPEDVGRVSPAVKGHPAFPKGATVAADTLTGDTIQLSGYGLGYDTAPATQERRQAIMGFDDAELYEVSGPIHWGDSGGPLVHVKTGKALVIVSRLCAGRVLRGAPDRPGHPRQGRRERLPRRAAHGLSCAGSVYPGASAEYRMPASS